jgi:antirestriction protein ArdC
MNRNLYRDVTDRILGEMEKGALPWVKPWSGYTGSQMPHNAATGRAYSGCNVVLLWIAQAAGNFTSPRFMTYKQAQELGGNVRKGEKGHMIVLCKRLREGGGQRHRRDRNPPHSLPAGVYRLQSRPDRELARDHHGQPDHGAEPRAAD